jgi:D-serine dehydratase
MMTGCMMSLSNHPSETPLDPREKGVPGRAGVVRLDEVHQQNWSLLAEDLPLPVALIKLSALRGNSAWMKGFTDLTGTDIAPHGKTTLSPSLFDLQMADGAWGITLSTPHHLQVARSFGYRRILLANQLVGRAAIEWIVAELNADPEFEFYCLVDSIENLEQLTTIARQQGLVRPLRVLVEIGFDGGRTGCRTVEQALKVARACTRASDVIALSGVEGFEGIIREADEPKTIARVETFLDAMVALINACGEEALFAAGEVLLTAGGSAFFDIVAAKLGAVVLPQPHRVLLRSGCYLTHDAIMYTYLFGLIKARRPDLPETLGELKPALEVWGYVQSIPEPGRVIVTLGKRDVSYDHMPTPVAWYRPGGGGAAIAAPEGHQVVALNDQHCIMTCPEISPLKVGDMLGFGISHPCLTFDKWRVLHLVDDEYRIVGSIRTYF